MSIAPIGGAIPAVPHISSPGSTPATGKADFAAGLEQVQKLTDQADQLGAQVATGKLENIHDFMAASAKANMAIELTAALRNKAVDAYQEIMRMQV